jgi:hypothetical protein
MFAGNIQKANLQKQAFQEGRGIPLAERPLK